MTGNMGSVRLLVLVFIFLYATDFVQPCRVTGAEPGKKSSTIRRVNAFEDVVSVLYRDATAMLRAPFHWKRENVLGFGLFFSGLTIAYATDEELRESMLGDAGKPFRRMERYVEPMGRTYTVQGISFGLYLLGTIQGDDDLKATGVTALEASLFAGTITGLLKESFGRRRPFEEQGSKSFDPYSGATSFPSNHTAQIFSFAAAVSEHYGRRASFILYPLAALVGLSRITGDLHWGSDVLTGAVIGTLVGRYLARDRDLGETSSFMLSSNPETGFWGIGLVI